MLVLSFIISLFKVASAGFAGNCHPNVPEDKLWEIDDSICQGKILWSNRTDLRLCRSQPWNECAKELVPSGVNGLECQQMFSRCQKEGGGGWPGKLLSAGDVVPDHELSGLSRLAVHIELLAGWCSNLELLLISWDIARGRLLL